MCLAVPGKIKSIQDMGGLGIAEVDIHGVRRQVSLDLLPEAEVGQYVLVHAGFAIQVVDEKEAEETLRLLKDLRQVELPENSEG